MPKAEKKFNQAEYTRKYQQENYYRLNVVLPKDMRERIDQAAARSGKSKNAYIREAIEEKMLHDL